METHNESKKYIEHTVSEEIEVDIDADDIIASIFETPESRHTLLRGLNQVYEFLKAVPDELIAKLSDSQKELISNFLNEQKDRFSI